MEREKYIRAAVRRARALGIERTASLDDLRRFVADWYDQGVLKPEGLTKPTSTPITPLRKK